MRIKFLSIIASFIFVSLAVSSCLDSDNQSMELSSDVTVHAFGIDTIYGKHYKFTIDQLNRLIYNQDSLPVGSDTVIDRILIDTFLVSGWITAGINDTVFVSTDSVDLTPALTTDRLTGLPSSSKGMTFKVHAQADALPGSGATREYTLRINRHNLEPDSLVWNLQGTSPAVGEQKALLFNNDLWLFTQTAAYKTSTSPEEYGWENAPAYAGFPENAKLETIVCFKREEAPGNAIKESLYVVTDDNRTYSSEDGTSWSETSWEGVNGIQTIIASFPNTLTLVTVDAKLYAATCNEEVWSVEEGEISGEGFPTGNIYSTNFETNGLPQVMVVGTTDASDSEQTTPWASSDGKFWVSLDNTAYDAFCPALKNPVIAHYGGKYYVFGSETANKLDVIYASPDGISWRETKEKFLLSEDISKISAPYSMIVDDPYIWIVFDGAEGANAVWRGYLNKLLFEKQ